MNKHFLFFAVIALAVVAAVHSQDTEGQGGNSLDEWNELVQVLKKYCAKITASDSEETSNNIRDERMFRRDVFKRETNDDGIDIEKIASKDGATILGNALGLACVGLFKLGTEQQEQESEESATANRELRHQGRSIW